MRKIARVCEHRGFIVEFYEPDGVSIDYKVIEPCGYWPGTKRSYEASTVDHSSNPEAEWERLKGLFDHKIWNWKLMLKFTINKIEVENT